MPFPRASQALSRFTVLDLTRVRSGPTCVRQLADWGANVIKIETPPHLDEGEGPGGPREGSDFQNLHRNKRSMTLDLKSPQGLAAFKRMVEKADVVVENFRPDVKDRLGIDYESLRKINKRIILGSISGFGQDGPYAKRPGFDQIAQGMGGLMSITGLPGQGPVRVGIPVADLCAGLFCALGILTALLEREVSGEGQWVSTSLLQAQIFMLDFQASRLLHRWRGAEAGRQQSPDLDSDRRVQDHGRPLNIAAAGAGDLGAFLQRGRRVRNGSPLPTTRRRSCARKNRDALNAEIDKTTATKTSAEWVEIFNKVGVPCGPIYSIDQVFADPQVKHLGIAQESDAFRRQPSLVWSASRSSCRARRARSRRGRRTWASTPTRCSPNSASAPMKSGALHEAKAV